MKWIENLLINMLLATFLFSTFTAFSAQRLPLDDYFTQTWNTRDGLPHNSINALAQTDDGYLWIGTWEGLVRFNGHEFKLFTRGALTGLPDSGIRSLESLSNGDLLVAGSRGGITVNKQGRWQVQPEAITMINHAIVDKDLGLWLALEGKGVVYRDNISLKDITIINNLSAYKLVHDGIETVWAATNKGLYAIKNKTQVTHYNQQHGLPYSPIYVVLITADKQLIVGSEHGAFKFKNGQFSPLHHELLNESISSILEDSKGDIWLGTINHGVFRLSDIGLEKLDADKGLPSNRISSLYEDKENSIWIGTNGGLFRLREAPFITLTTKQGLSGDYIRSIFSHSDGSLWIGSSKGLNKIQGKKISAIERPTSDTQVSVLSLAENSNGSVLVGTYTEGIFKVVDGILQPYLNNQTGLPSNEVRALLIDSNNNTWIGTASGLVIQSPNGELRYLNEQQGLPANFIMALTEDKLGQVWIGTGVGVVSYNNGIIQSFNLHEQLNAEYAFGFHVEDDAIWMATDRGIVRLNLTTHKMSSITRDNGLPVDKFFQIIVDKSDNFWLTSNRGVVKITRQQLTSVLDNNINNSQKMVEYELFGEGEGLLSAQANGGSNPAATLHHDGSVWIATSKGASQVTQKRLTKVAEIKLPIMIEQLMVDDKNYPLFSTFPSLGKQKVNLPAGSSRIAIKYAGLGFLMPQRIQYQTQLIGFDETWVNKNNQNFTEYTNLAPRDYIFKIRAKYPNGEWLDTYASIEFTLSSFFWQTKLFYFIISLITLTLLYLLFNYRLLTIQRNEEKLKNLVAKQTEDLKRQAQSFAYQATHDQLTGLSNRRAFDHWCDEDFAQATFTHSALSLAMIDIDHFKQINDNFSHIIGDKVICEIATLLQNNCTDVAKLARWGGEEFALLLPLDRQKTYNICQHLCDLVANHDFSAISSNLNVTISIGVTDNNSVNDYERMLNQADKALYLAKNNGRNQVQVIK